MTEPQIVSAVMAFALGLSIVYLVRRDHLSPGVAGKWIFLSILILVVGLFPDVIDKIGWALGIAYPPILVIIVAMAVLLLKLLIADIENQKLKVKVDRTIQKLAMLEAELKEIRSKPRY